MWSKRNVNRTCAWIPALSCHVMSCHLICLWLGGCSWSCVLSVILHFSTDGFSESWLGQNEFFWRPSSRVCWPSPKNRPHLVRAERKYGEQIGSVCTFTVTARQNVVLYKPLTRCRVVELFWVFGQQRTFDVTPSHTRSTYTEEEKKKTEVWLRISATHTVELMLVAVPHNTSVSRSPERAPSPYPYWPMSTSVFRLNAGSCTTSS